MALTDKLTAIADAIRVQSEKTDKLSLDQMVTEIAELNPVNFKVVGNPQPESPSGNTIWVNTDTPITSWIFSAMQPSSLASGVVWIFIGTSSSVEFNALKKNGIQVYPISAKQCIDGAWVDKTAKIYQNGDWSGLVPDVYLYNKGDECVDITGGWSITSNGGNKPMSLTKANGYLNITASWSGNYTSHSTTSTGNTVDVSKHSKLNILYDFSASAGSFVGAGTPYQNLSFGLGSSKTGISSSASGKTGTNQTATLDISSFDGEFYVVIESSNYCTSGNVNIKVYDMWLSA